MGRKVHVICAKCGSDEMDIVLTDLCPDDPQAIAAFGCSNCGELTSVSEWAEANSRKVIDKRTPLEGLE